MAARPKLDPSRPYNASCVAWKSGWNLCQRVKLTGFTVVLAELEVELDDLRRAMRYLEE